MSKKKTVKEQDEQLQKDIKKFNIVFESWPDDEKILHNRIHSYDRARHAIEFAVQEYSFDEKETIDRYNSFMKKLKSKEDDKS